MLDTVSLLFYEKEEKIYQRLRNIDTVTNQDNEEVLQLLFPVQDDMPLQQYSRQIEISEVKEKVILVLISNPQLVPVEPFHFLLQQLYDNQSSSNTEHNYEILWIPIASSKKWTEEEKGIFSILSNCLPWISVRRPWLISSTVVKFIRREWAYREGETMVVVMDSDGKVVNMNAMDMMLIWGLRAYPFSVRREDELWEEDGWSIQLLLEGIHPEFETWVHEGREMCIIGSESWNWVEEVKSVARKIRKQGIHFELINLSMEKLFWLRLQSIKRSKLKRLEPDRVLQEVNELLDFDYDTHIGWAIVGKGSTTATEKVIGEELTERMRRIVRWGEDANGLSFTEAIQIAAREKPCEVSSTVVVPFEEGSTMKAVTCQNCKRPMKKFVAYQ